LEIALEVKTEEVQTMLTNITNIYECLEIPEDEQLALATQQVCPLVDLLSGENYCLILEENRKANQLKKENMDRLVQKARIRLETLQQYTLHSRAWFRRPGSDWRPFSSTRFTAGHKF